MVLDMRILLGIFGLERNEQKDGDNCLKRNFKIDSLRQILLG
jgi:hypothetical protein